MGQKVNPNGFRVGVIKDWNTRWYASKKDFADYLVEDRKIRDFVKKKYFLASISRIEIDRAKLEGRVDFIGEDADTPLDPVAAAAVLAARTLHPAIAPHPRLPDDTRLWAALQEAGGGTWAGCVYDVDAIIDTLRAGREALAGKGRSA